MQLMAELASAVLIYSQLMHTLFCHDFIILVEDETGKL